MVAQMKQEGGGHCFSIKTVSPHHSTGISTIKIIWGSRDRLISLIRHRLCMDVFIRPVESAKSTYPTVPMVIGWRVLADRGWHGCVWWVYGRFRHTVARTGWRGRWGSDGEDIGPMAAEDNGVDALVAGSYGSLLGWSWSYVAEGLHMLRSGRDKERQEPDHGLLLFGPN